MQTAESVGIVAERLNDELGKIRSQVDRLDDVTLSLNAPEIEADLRRIATGIRESIDFICKELEPEESWIAS